jgi:uncharacterized protein (TIGR03000 family)
MTRMLLGAILACGTLLALDTSAQAQWGRGRGGGGRVGVYVGTPYFSFSYGPRYGYYGPGGYSGYGYYGPGFYRPYAYGTYPYTYRYPYYGSRWYTGSYDRPWSYAPAPSYPSYTYSPPAVVETQPVDTTATIRVLLPSEDARVWFNGKPTEQSGFERVFSSPPLQEGTTYYYSVKASWMAEGKEVSRERDVAIQAGREVLVDLRE